jgi:PiT family inorganic phosphate transporter
MLMRRLCSNRCVVPIDHSLSALTITLLVLAIGLALAFEFVNGFHDTANAVATVIYTHSLPPMAAVVWSGLWNFIGVLTSSGAVAFAVVQLLPVDLVLNVGTGAGFAMVFALLTSAILWNAGTWYLGLPASSSHTLIGAVLGVGLANSLLDTQIAGSGVNWGQARNVGLSLLISPVVGFVFTALLFLLLKKLVHKPVLYLPPEGKKPPPPWIRGCLLFTCTGVSFAHGSNDGQKGMGLILLIVIGLAPASFALRMNADPAEVRALQADAAQLSTGFSPTTHSPVLLPKSAATVLEQYVAGNAAPNASTNEALALFCGDIASRLKTASTLQDVPPADRGHLRTDLYLVSAVLNKLGKTETPAAQIARGSAATDFRRHALTLTEYIPVWIKLMVALALGCGTMIGWKRIVTTLGEKIGKSHLTYGQGASAELVAMGTIMAADRLGLPVSTTHVLSSGIAGAMAANHSGLQARTLRNILLAWVLTLPVCVFLGALLFALGLNLVFWLGLK